MLRVHKKKFLQTLVSVDYPITYPVRDILDRINFENGRGLATLYNHFYELWRSLTRPRFGESLNLYEWMEIFSREDPEDVQISFSLLSRKSQKLSFEDLCDFLVCIPYHDLKLIMTVCYRRKKSSTSKEIAGKRRLSVEIPNDDSEVISIIQEDDASCQKKKTENVGTPEKRTSSSWWKCCIL